MADTQELHAKNNAKEREIATTRGEAQAMTSVGIAGGAGWAALEFLALAGEVAQASQTKKGLAFAAGIIAIGALAYAGLKYAHANKLEEDHKSWLDKLRSPKSHSLER